MEKEPMKELKKEPKKEPKNQPAVWEPCPDCSDGLCNECGGLLGAARGCEACGRSGLCWTCNGVGAVIK